MTTDMLLTAGTHRTSSGATPTEGAAARPAMAASLAAHGARATRAGTSVRDAGKVATAGLASVDLRALVARAVIPRLRESFDVTPDLRPVPQLAIAPALALAGDASGNVGELVECLLRADLEGACGRIDALRDCGQPLGRIYIDLLMPAALRIARLLADDLCDATQATLAFCNMQIILRRYADAFQGGGRAASGLRALLVSTPLGVTEGAGLQLFGLVFAAEFFRRDGWEVWTERNVDSEAFRDVALRQWFDLVEVLATEASDLDAMASGIRRIRRDAPNPRVAVVACGQIFARHPEYVRMIGADRSASDPLASLPHAREFALGPAQRRRLS